MKLNSRFGGPPVYSGFSPARIVRAKILSVDKVKYTCAVHGEMNNEVHSGVALMPTHLNSEGSGSFHVPEANANILEPKPQSFEQVETF
jgi:hypothetical protein